MAPLTATVMNSVPQQHVGLASGINNAVTRVGGLLTIAVAGAVLWTVFNARIHARLNAMHATPAQRAAVNRQRADLTGGTYTDPRVRHSVAQAYDAAFSDIALLCCGLAGAASATAFLMLASASPRRTRDYLLSS